MDAAAHRDDCPALICLYDEGASGTLSVPALAVYVREHLPQLEVEVRDEFFRHHLRRAGPETDEQGLREVATKIAECKVVDLSTADIDLKPMLAEVRYEMRRLAGEAKAATGIMYDGAKLQRVLYSLMAKCGEELSDSVHVVFTNRLFGTFDELNGRYHARVSLYGVPNLISTTGMVEAPARSREHYLHRMLYPTAASAPRPVTEDERCIRHDDPRMTEVMKGYLMQALFFHTAGDAFCGRGNCRLYNAHWQEEVITAQLEGGSEFCETHARALEAWRSSAAE